MRLLACVLALVFAAVVQAGFFTPNAALDAAAAAFDVLGGPAPVQQVWVKQPVDHFATNGSDLPEWNQRVFINDDFAEDFANAPIFIFVGGHGPISHQSLLSGFMFSAAQKHGARMLAVEHRYYGHSVPVPDFSVENLAFLSAKQALADIAHLIETFEGGAIRSSRVVLFGAGYAGTLAAWFRLKYPALSAGAVADSAPLAAVVDFRPYYSAMERSLALFGSEQCVADLYEALARIELLIRRPEGPAQLTGELNLCSPAPNHYSGNRATFSFYFALADRLARLVQHNDAADPVLGAEGICHAFAEGRARHGNAFFGLAATLQAAMDRETGRRGACLPPLFEDLIAPMQATVVAEAAASGARQWAWQQCNELGLFTTSGPGLKRDFYVKQDLFWNVCEAVFDVKRPRETIAERVAATAAEFGALEFAGSRVFFVAGAVDPWASAALRPDSPEAAKPVAEGRIKTVLVARAAHGAVLGTRRSEWLDEARRAVSKEVAEWLATAPPKARGAVSQTLLRMLKLA